MLREQQRQAQPLPYLTLDEIEVAEVSLAEITVANKSILDEIKVAEQKVDRVREALKAARAQLDQLQASVIVVPCGIINRCRICKEVQCSCPDREIIAVSGNPNVRM